MFQTGILCIYTPVLVCNEMKNSLNIVKNVSNVYQLLFIAVKNNITKSNLQKSYLKSMVLEGKESIMAGKNASRWLDQKAERSHLQL